MHDISDDDRKQALGEVQHKVIREYLEEPLPIKEKVAKLEEDMNAVKSDIKIIKAAVINQGCHLQDLEVRTTRLEVAR